MHERYNHTYTAWSFDFLESFPNFRWSWWWWWYGVLVGKKQSLGLGWMNLLYSYTFVYACFPTSEEIMTETSLVSCTYVDTRSFIKIIKKRAWSSSFFHAWMWICVASFLSLVYINVLHAKMYEITCLNSISNINIWNPF